MAKFAKCISTTKLERLQNEVAEIDRFAALAAELRSLRS